MSPAQHTRSESRSSDLPEGALLVVAAVAATGALLAVPAVIAALLIVVRRVLGIPARWFGVACAALALTLVPVGVQGAIDSYAASAPVWRIGAALDEDPLAWLRAVLPLALPLAGVLAIVGELWHAWHSPFWDRDRRARRSLVAGWRTRRARVQLARPATHGARSIDLGVNGQGRVVRLSQDELAQHALVVGATGAGKTTTLLRIAERLIAQGAAVVAIDLKGDPQLRESLTALAGRYDRAASTWSLSGPTRWNPLAIGDASELSDKLIALEEWTEPHYKRAAQRYLHTAVASLIAAGRTPDIAQVVEMMDVATLRALAAQHLPPERAARVNAYLHSLDKSATSAINGLANRLALLAESTSGDYLTPPLPPVEPDRDGEADTTVEADSSPPDEGVAAEASGDSLLDVGAAIEQRGVVMFSLDSQRYGETAAQIAALALLDLKTIAARRMQAGTERVPAFVLVDEFSAIGSDHVVALLARARSAGMGVVLSTQELADLSRIDEGFADQVLGNTNVKIIHRQDVPESAERLASVAGTEPGYQETLQTERAPVHMLGDTRISGGVGAHTGVGTIREVEQFVVHPNRLKALAQGEAVVIVKHPRVRVEQLRIAPASSVGGAR